MATDYTARRAQQRRAARQAQAREESRYAAQVAVWVARLTRRAPCALDADAARHAAGVIDTGRLTCDRLATRTRPEVYPGWRRDTYRRMAYLLGNGAGQGLPLAAEGGAPIRCADWHTAELSQANYRARSRAA
jgi:hypothetical protein